MKVPRYSKEELHKKRPDQRAPAVVNGDVFNGVKIGDIVERGQVAEMIKAAGFEYVLNFTYQSNPTIFKGFHKIK